jgi:hypothetical protein
LTWSSSPFNMTAALVHNQKLTRFNSRCMCCVSDQGVDPCPMNPSNTQPSAWHAHFSIRMVVICLWAVVVSYATWAGMVTYSLIHYPSPYVWSFLPQEMALTYGYSAVNIRGWIVLFLNIAAIQGPLTIGLHCSELITNVIRDEGQWRCATEKKGLKTTTNPLMSVLTHLICLILFAMKPFLRESFASIFVRCYSTPTTTTDWMYGLSANVAGGAEDGKISGGLAVVMYAAQVCICCPCKTTATSSHTRSDLELMCSAVYICLFFYFHRTAPTPRPPASCIRPPPDARQPHRLAFESCDVVGPQEGRTCLSCR